MKNLKDRENKLITVFAAIALMLCAAGCNNILQPKAGAPSTDPGKGLVQIHIGTVAGRTLLPAQTDLHIDQWVITFTAAGSNQQPSQTLTGTDLSQAVQVEAGEWALSLEAKKDGVVIAGGTASSNITVVAGQQAGATVTLVFTAPGSGTGSLEYTITNNSSITLNSDGIKIELRPLSVAGIPEPIGSSLTGTKSDINAGYYLVSATLSGDGKKALKSDVAHIYKGQTTKFAWTFEAADFHAAIERVWLVGAMNATAWTLPGTEMAEQTDGTFAWAGLVSGDHRFRFSLLDTSGWSDTDNGHTGDNKWWGHWFAPENDDTGCLGSSIPVNYYNYTKKETAWQLAGDGWYKIVLDPYTKTMTVSQPFHITGVTIDGGNTSVNLGSTKQFAATVVGYNSPAQTVNWSIEGNHHVNTTIIGGLLSIDASETESTLTIRATSTADTLKYGDVTVTVLSATTPSVNSITVAIDGTNVTEKARGTTLDFVATVTVSNGAAQTVVWSVTGKDKDGSPMSVKMGTTIADNGDNHHITLTIAADEEAVDLVVTATSTVSGFTNVSGSKPVFVEKYNAVYLLGTDFGNWTKPAAGSYTGAALIKGTRGIFTIDVNNMNADSTFKFHDNTATGWNDGVWFTANGNDVAPSGNMQVVVANASGNNNAWKTSAPGKYSITLNTTAQMVTFTPIPEVMGITVTPSTPSVNRGNTQQFSVAVNVTHSASQAVAWSVSGNGSSSTTISTGGFLTVGREEGNTLTITATSTLAGFTTVSGSTTVTVTNAVDSITITGTDKFTTIGATVGVSLGETQTFSVAVTTYPTGGNGSVTWSLEGATTFGTEINPSTGVLVIAANEAIPRTITVRATSTLDTSKFHTVQVKVIQVSTIWIIGGMNSWSNNWTSGWNTGYDLSRSADGTFTWTGNLTTDTIFRFCLVDSSAWTGGDKWATCWYKSDSDNLPVSPGTPYSLNYVHYQNAGNRNWLISPAGNYTITVDAGTNLMRVTKN